MLTGRTTELRFLKQYYEKEGSQVLVVYGVKGVGKTALIRNFTVDKPSACYVARACSDREQRWQWARELWNPDEEHTLYPGTYPEENLEYKALLSESYRLASVQGMGKLVMVIEDFQHLIKGDGSFFTALLESLRKQTRVPVLVILCSSASGWVENSMVRKLGGGAASLSGLLKIREMKLAEMNQLYPGYSRQICRENYAILGGVPGLWNCFEEGLTLEKNLIRNLLSPRNRLFLELSTYMEVELREPAVYNTILATMAAGSNKLNDIYIHTGFSRAKISVYLKNLMELELVEKVKSGSYRIVNPGICFYFRFLFPNKSLLEQVSAREFYDKVMKPALPAYIEEAYSQYNTEELE